MNKKVKFVVISPFIIGTRS